MAKKRRAAGIALGDTQDWQTESDLRTLMDAEKIEKDPKRYKAVCALAKKRLVEMASIASEGSE